MAEWVAGRIPVLECLRAGRRIPRKLYLLEGAKGLEAIREAAKGVPTEDAPRRELDRLMPDTPHQGALLKAEPLPVELLEDFLRQDLPQDAVIVLLDEIEDPHNFGAIVRSASALGASAAAFGQRRSAPLSPAALKSAAGAMEHLPLLRARNLARGLEALKEAGFWIASLDQDAPQLLWEADLRGRVGLVIGNEGRGVRRLVAERSDFHLRIPLQGPITSLNASVSAAIALTECARQRGMGKG